MVQVQVVIDAEAYGVDPEEHGAVAGDRAQFQSFQLTGRRSLEQIEIVMMKIDLQK